MGKHINRKQLNQYLEGSLAKEERQQIWTHLQHCPKCYACLRDEENLRADIQRDFVGFATREDFATLLPGILAETRRSPISQHPLAIMVTVFMAVVAFFPLVPHLAHTTYASNTDLLNVPISTQSSPIREQPTLESVDSDSEFDETAFNMGYASPAPYPQATADSSPMPKNDME